MGEKTLSLAICEKCENLKKTLYALGKRQRERERASGTGSDIDKRATLLSFLLLLFFLLLLCLPFLAESKSYVLTNELNDNTRASECLN